MGNVFETEIRNQSDRVYVNLGSKFIRSLQDGGSKSSARYINTIYLCIYECSGWFLNEGEIFVSDFLNLNSSFLY